MSNCDCEIIHQEVVDLAKKEISKEEKLIDMADFFKIFGDSTRLQIIKVLMISKTCVCDIANALNMSHSAISHQLRVLKNFKIVKFTKVGKVVYYELDDDHIRKIFNLVWEHMNE